jgi:AhpD family alkylhydroperoxidase
MSKRIEFVSMRIDYQAVSPAGVRSLRGIYTHVRDCGLDPTLIDLAYLRVSQINGCAYCIDLHTKDLFAKGVAHSKIALIEDWREGGASFSARERAALRWAEAITQIAVGGVPDEEYQSVIGCFSEKETVDLTIAVGLMNTFNRIAIAFRKQPQSTLASVA